MALQFYRAIEHMEVWSASRDGFSFVITHGSRAGHGFRGQPGYVASWRPLDQSRGAIKIGGSPRIASSRMLPEDSAPMTGAASPNQVGGANGKRDQHGRSARGVGGGGEALPYGRAS